MVIEDLRPSTSVTASIDRLGDPPAPPSRIPLLLDAEGEPQPDWERLDTMLHQNFDVLEREFRAAGIFNQATIINNRHSIYLLKPEEHCAEIVEHDERLIEQLEGITNADLAAVFSQILDFASELPIHELETFPRDNPDTDHILSFGRHSYLLQVFQGLGRKRYFQVSRVGDEKSIYCNVFTAELAAIGFYGGQFNRLDPIDIIQFFPHLENKLTSNGQRFFQSQIDQRRAEEGQRRLEQKRKEDHARLEVERLHSVIDTYLGYLEKLKSTLKIDPGKHKSQHGAYAYNSFEQALKNEEQYITSRRDHNWAVQKDETDAILFQLISRLEYELRYLKVDPERLEDERIKHFLDGLVEKDLTVEQYVQKKIEEVKEPYSLLCASLSKKYERRNLWSDYRDVWYLTTLFSLTDPASEHPAVPFITDLTPQVAEMLKSVKEGFHFGEFPMWGGRAHTENEFFEVSIGCKYDEFDETMGKSRGKLSKNTIVVKIKPKYKLAPGSQYPFSRISVSLQAGHNQGETNTQAIFGPYQLTDDGALEINGLYEELGYSTRKLQELDSKWVVKASYT